MSDPNDKPRSPHRSTVAEIAAAVGGQVIGDGDAVLIGISSLADAAAGHLTFFSDKRQRRHLATTAATAVLVREDHAGDCPGAAIVVDNPYAAYARAATLLHPPHRHPAGIHPSAAIAPSAVVDPTAWVGANAVVEDGVKIAAEVEIGPGCVVGHDAEIGAGSQLMANVTIGHDSILGERALIHSGTIIGADGFGQAPDQGRWVKIPQIGRVVIGDDVEIGANSTVDRGAIGETVIEDGVRIDNQVQIAHNVQVGAHTAMAAQVGISGSTTIGRHCQIGGQAGLGGHLTICDGAVIAGGAEVRQSIDKPGIYASGGPLEPMRRWYKNTVRIRELNDMAKRLRTLERRLEALDEAASDEPG